MVTEKIPQHVAIIMDGNRRWATEQGLSSIEGHKAAVARMEELIEYSVQKGVRYLTLWAWSNKNWKRNAVFISEIIGLFREQLLSGELFVRAVKKGASLRHIGNLERFPSDIKEKFSKLMELRPEEERIAVNIALGYDGRDDVLQAIQKIAAAGVDLKDITADLINEHLYTHDQPDVDLLIRTGGDKRTSGFMIWQAAEAEFYFTDTYFPDFGAKALQLALDDFSLRERRLGGDGKEVR